MDQKYRIYSRLSGSVHNICQETAFLNTLSEHQFYKALKHQIRNQKTFYILSN